MFTNVKDFINWVQQQKRFTPKQSLQKMNSLCEVYGNPQQNLQFIHVAGTNGKGSTVSFIQSILRNANLNVGSFISPYVIEFNERISYNGEYISDDDLLLFGNQIISKYDVLNEKGIEQPTFFEFLTLLALLYFNSRDDIDIVILEVGIGGSLDSTNIITPLISVITNISIDHIRTLGTTKAEIALNKLGIVKQNVPLVTMLDEDIHHLFIKATQEKGSKLITVDDLEITNIKLALDHTSFTYQDNLHIKLQLLGYHQVKNSLLAIAVCYELAQQFNITQDHITKGLADTFIPGRLEVINRNPTIVIDGAHNLAGIESLINFLASIKCDQCIKVYFAVSNYKDKKQMIAALDNFADEIIFTEFSYHRSVPALNLYNLSCHPNKKKDSNLNNILTNISKETDSINVFCGSLYLISEVRDKIK